MNQLQVANANVILDRFIVYGSQAWDNDLSDHDLDQLRLAGFTETQVRETVETMISMLRALDD